jgi:hypothetical protein
MKMIKRATHTAIEMVPIAARIKRTFIGTGISEKM